MFNVINDEIQKTTGIVAVLYFIQWAWVTFGDASRRFTVWEWMAIWIVWIVLGVSRKLAAWETAQQPPKAASDVPTVPLETRVRALLASGQRIEAVRLIREETGFSLNDAKDYVQKLQSDSEAKPS